MTKTKHPCLTRWRARCNRVIKYGTRFTKLEIDKAGNWDTCACGGSKKICKDSSP